MEKHSNLKRFIALLLLCVLCFQLVSCDQRTLEETINGGRTFPPNDSILWCPEGSPFYLYETEFYRSAMQVPLGQIKIAEASLAQIAKAYPYVSDDSIFGFAVNLAGMLPSNTALSEKVKVETFEKAREFFEKEGISAFFSEKYTISTASFFVFATMSQIQKVTCDKSSALLVMWVKDPGIEI